MKCFYHSADLDGHCSGAIIKMRYPECELIGINCGDEFPWDKITQFPDPVFMVDFCLQPFDDMLRLNKNSRLVWIDHHRTAIDVARASGFLAAEQSLEIGIGACAMVWDYCYPGKPRPHAVQLLAEYDVWDHSNGNTLPFQWGMRIENTIPEDAMDLWSKLLGDRQPLIPFVEQITEKGDVILEYVAQDNRKHMDACGFDTALDGLRCIAINRMLTNAQMFDSVWDEEKYDAMLTFGWRKGSWTVSLYSTKEYVDVSVTAKNRGGGGHKGAAGFQCSELPFETR